MVNSCLSFPAAGNTTYPAQCFTLKRAKGASWSKNLDVKILLPILKINVHYKLYLKYVTFWDDVNKSKSQPLVVQHVSETSSNRR